MKETEWKTDDFEHEDSDEEGEEDARVSDEETDRAKKRPGNSLGQDELYGFFCSRLIYLILLSY